MANKKLLALLEEFQAGYSARDKQAVDKFVDKLFMPGNSAFVLGTGSGELFSGAEKVRELVSDDWEYWGDLRLNLNEARLGTAGDHGWFAVEGSVSRSFEDSAARSDRYLSFVADKIKDDSMSPETRLALVNWVLSLTFSQRAPGKRDYKVPVMMSGSVRRLSGEWKFSHIHFAMAQADYPDERFEESEAFAKSYAEALKLTESYKENMLNAEIEAMLKDFQEQAEAQCIPEDLRRLGALNLETGKAIANYEGDQGWILALGTLCVDQSREGLFDHALARLDNILTAEAATGAKLFSAHRLAASALKRGAAGSKATYPVRLTASITRAGDSWRIAQAHFSYPDFWLLEGKAGRPE